MRPTFSRVAYPYPSPASAEMVAILNELRKERRARWVHLSVFLKASSKTILAISSRFFFQVGEKAAEPSEQSIVANN